MDYFAIDNNNYNFCPVYTRTDVKDLEFHDIIGRGSFAVVYRGREGC